jgi:hypothetical protein
MGKPQNTSEDAVVSIDVASKVDVGGSPAEERRRTATWCAPLHAQATASAANRGRAPSLPSESAPSHRAMVMTRACPCYFLVL